MHKVLIFIVIVIFSGCNNDQSRKSIVYVENFRKSGLTDDQVIQKAIVSAGPGGTVSFGNNKEYLIENVILVPAFQRLIGNNATLRRAAQSYSTLAKTVNSASSVIELDSIPSGWKPGDQLQMLTDSTAGGSNGFGDYPHLPNIIVTIKKNVITLSSKIGSSEGGDIASWPAGAKVRKVYSILRGDSINRKSVPFTVINLNFDGNRKQNNLNYYWNVNSTIFMRGQGGKIEDCRFRDIPNENIVGQGMLVLNCQAQDLNGSFVHLSGDDSMRPIRQKHAIIIGNTIERVCQVSTYTTGHSEGVFTTSYNGGYATVANNRVYFSAGSAIGTIDGHLSVDDGGKSEFIFTGNLFKHCKRIFHDVRFAPKGSTLPTDICLMGNVFSNCGKNDWSIQPNSDGHCGISMKGNIFSNGTTWKLPGTEGTEQ